MVTDITTDGETTTLVTSEADGHRQVIVPTGIDTRTARRLLGTVRRIDRVIIETGPDGHRASARGRRHRLPFSGPIPLAAALGLTRLGVPTSVERGTTRWSSPVGR